MFHRVKKEAILDQTKANVFGDKEVSKIHNNNTNRIENRTGVNQTAVQRFAKSQEEMSQQISPANKNSNRPHAVKQYEPQLRNSNSPINQPTSKIEEVNTMNNPQSKDDAQTSTTPTAPAQGRVDIPGQNFQRPGASAPASRPSYPGASYPGAQNSGSAYNPQANDRPTGPKLVIGQGITMSGEIEACDHLIVEGTIEASLKGASVLDVAESGSYFGTVEIEEANISGRFEGDITVKGRLTIESTGTVIGTISYKELSMEAGATVDGTISPIGSTNVAKNVKAAPSKSKKATNNGAELPFASQAD